MQNYSSRTQRILQMAKETNIKITKKQEIFTQNPTTTEEIIDTTLLSINNENNQLTDIETLTASMFQRSTESLDENDNCYTVTEYDCDCPTVMRLTKIKPNNFYYVSPVHSNESDVDDSDADKNFTHSSTDGLSESSDEHDVVHCSSDSSGKPEVGSSSLETLDKGNVDKNEVEMDTKKGRKRGRKPENWINKQASLLRNSGKAYQSSSKSKKQFPQRKVGPPCGEKCRLACSNKINNLIRQEIFDHFWGLANLERQREFIVRHSTFIKPKYRYSSTQDHRKLNSAFYFDINKTRVRVCKAFFKSTLDINDRPIRTALMKKNDNGFLEPEMRGKHGKQPTIDPELKNSVRQFIEAIPRVESHYLRAQTTREFIDSGKSLADLFRDYKEDRQKQNLPFTNASMFNRIFRGEYNISFYVPKKDQCDICESFKNADEERRTILFSAYNLHQKEKELSRIEKDNDKKNLNGAHVAVYDLQAVMPVPKGQISSFYYKSKINCFNFTISDLNARNVECYFWDETEGKRGAIEIGSCILHYIKMLIEKTNNNDQDIVFYSDNCCGQQKNKYVLSAYSYAVNKFPKLRSVTHKYLIRGHSQNEGDNVHSVIEKQVSRHLKACPIYVPQQYATLITMAKKNGPPYHVNELTHENFYDLKILQEEWGSNFTMDTDRTQIKWQEIKVLRVEKQYPFAFFYKASYEDVTFKRANVRNLRKRKHSGTFQEPQSFQLVQAYEAKIPLAENKKKDIQELVNKNIIPQSYYNSYFKNVLN